MVGVAKIVGIVEKGKVGAGGEVFEKVGLEEEELLGLIEGYYQNYEGGVGL